MGRTEAFLQESKEETWRISVVSSLSTPMVFLEVSRVLAGEHGCQEQAKECTVMGICILTGVVLSSAGVEDVEGKLEC